MSSGFFDYPGQDGADAGNRDMEFLSGQTTADWERLLAHTQTRRFGAGDVLIREGDPDRSLLIVTEGRIEVLMQDRTGRGLHQWTTYEHGTVVGEQTFLDGRPRSATIRALTDGALVRLSRESFDVLSAREPQLARAILLDLGRILSLRLRMTTGALQKMWD
jgi:CRP/FNR family cyclic AMP-dependent transcriptional regulator